MTDHNSLSVLLTKDNVALPELGLSWKTATFPEADGIEPLGSLHEAGDALVAVGKLEQEAVTILGSGVMVGPGMLLTATHVLDAFPCEEGGLVFLTFLPGAVRAWLARDVVTVSGKSNFDGNRKVVSDLSLVSCSLNSEAHAEFPLMLAPMQVALPLIGERLWALGFRHWEIRDRAAIVTPFVSSGLVTAAFPNGRGERLASPCVEVDMDTLGGMSGGAVFNSDGYLVGIVSSSFEGGPSYVTLIWEAIRLSVKGTIPKLAVNKSTSLLGAKALGLAKLKGDVIRNPWGDVTLVLSNEEAKLFVDSVPPAAAGAPVRPGLNVDQFAGFVKEWGADMETAAREGAMDSLKRLSLTKVRSFLRASGMSTKCLGAIRGFSVEDFEGIEDFRVTSTEFKDHVGLIIEYYFDLRTLIWTVEVRDEFFQANVDEFLKHSVNVQTDGRIAMIDVVQRWYFKGSMVFDRDRQLFSDVSIIDAVIKRPRSVIPSRTLNE